MSLTSSWWRFSTCTSSTRPVSQLHHTNLQGVWTTAGPVGSAPCTIKNGRKERQKRTLVSGAAAFGKQSPQSSAAASMRDSSEAAGSGPVPKKYAVVGGGFAGVAAAWHLLSHATKDNPIALDLFDAFGLGAGGSGAAAGLLHPYTNRGKVLWRGLEAFQAAKELVEAAEAAVAAASHPLHAPAAPVVETALSKGTRLGQQSAACTQPQQAGAASKVQAVACAEGQPGGRSGPGWQQRASGDAQEGGFTWRDGILRPARSIKQARDLAKFVPLDQATAETTGAQLLDATAMERLVPGLPSEDALLGVPAREESASEPPQDILSSGQSGSPQHASQLRGQLEGGGLGVGAGSVGAALQGRRSAGAAGGGGGAGDGVGRDNWRRGSDPPTRGVAPPVDAQEGPPTAAGLLVTQAVVLHPLRYLRALWSACCQQAQRAGGTSQARLILRHVASLEGLEAEEGPYDAVVVAAGAAVGNIPELRGVLPLQLSQGYTLVMSPGGAVPEESAAGAAGGGGPHGNLGSEGGTAPPPQQAVQRAKQDGRVWEARESSGFPGTGIRYPADAPSLLGSTYLSAHGRDSLVVGATKRFGLTPEEAFRECSRGEVVEEGERRQAAQALLPAAAELWPPVLEWRVAQVKSGVRALPARGNLGAIPFAGRVPPPHAQQCSDLKPAPAGALGTPPPAQQAQQEGAWGQHPARNWWFVGGLGARGLVYHAWLGKVVAAAVVQDSESALPAELLRWRDHTA